MSGLITYPNLNPATNDTAVSLLGKILTVLLVGFGEPNPDEPGLPSALVGTVLDFAGATPPEGFLLCYGQEVSRETYAALFGVIGVTYGEGDGSTTFNLPDLRGRVVAGKDNMGGISMDRLTNNSGAGVDGDTLGAAGGSESLSTNDLSQSGSDSVSLSTDNNVQPTFILNKIIFTGV